MYMKSWTGESYNVMLIFP